jgi:uncharacterized protein YecA (UPF0149 family)
MTHLVVLYKTNRIAPRLAKIECMLTATPLGLYELLFDSWTQCSWGQLCSREQDGKDSEEQERNACRERQIKLTIPRNYL